MNLRIKQIPVFLLVITAALLALSGCSAPAPAAAGADGENRLQVLATTTIIADVVQNIAGDRAVVTALIPPGVDEHGYEPAPRDLAMAGEADLIFTNGAGLEPFLERLVANTGDSSRIIPVSDGIDLLNGMDAGDHPDDEGEANEDQHSHEGDPHVWMDPNNVMVWVDNIQQALSQADPAGAPYYEENASRYRQELADLDQWIQEQVSQIPPEKRNLVTDHLIFTYFADRYGFNQVGAIVPGYSTAASPSAKELAQLEDAIRELGVPVVFVGNTVNPDFAERVSQDTGTKLVPILTGSLTGEDGHGPTYIAYIRYNVEQIVNALK
ncbi:MAG: zinc ABC transporter solute-binding protein [Chloroflexi bacterium]|nr:zinc ABC transporter solute-binding protein [Chloroflexota bacterium]